jgi:peptide/nickel transport system permease protein
MCSTATWIPAFAYIKLVIMASITQDEFQPVLPREELPPQDRVPRWLKVLVRNPVSITGTILVILFAIVAALAPVLTPPPIPSQPYNIPRDGFTAEPQPPGPGEPLGTTQGQYDLYYGIIWGTRTAFKIGLIVTSLAVFIGGTVGAVSGYVGGWVDEVLQRIVEIFLAFPFLLAALTLATILGAKIQNGLITGMIALIAFGWPGYARLIRGDVLSVKEREYVLAAKAMYSLLVVGSLDIGTNVLTFAALSFLGVGAGEGYADWGQLLSYARNWIPTLNTHWWIVVYPGLALLLFVLAFNLIGDAFRDALDPKMRGGRGA